MMDFPITELLDESICTLWLERHLHPNGVKCPHGASSVVSRETGEHRFWVCDHADTRTYRSLIANHVPAGSTPLYTDEWQSDRGSHPFHATVRHGVHEWARDDDDDDGRREVHCNTCEGAGVGLRTYLRACRGVHQQYLHLDVATYEAMLNTKRVTSMLMQRMCVRSLSAYSGYT